MCVYLLENIRAELGLQNVQNLKQTNQHQWKRLESNLSHVKFNCVTMVLQIEKDFQLKWPQHD